MIEEYYDNGHNKRGVNGSMNGDARKNGISLPEFEELCANLKAQQVTDIPIYRYRLRIAQLNRQWTGHKARRTDATGAYMF